MRKDHVTGKSYYTSGEFAHKAHVSLRTVRYYDKIGLLHPSVVTEGGARLYSDHDFVRLEQILLFKYLGFSLDEIKEMTFASQDAQYLINSLRIQRKLVQERMEEMQEVSTAIDQMIGTVEKGEDVHWEDMLKGFNVTSMERSLKTQYLNATNINARIELHSEYSTNPQGWFPWAYEQCDITDGMHILEVGCGNGELWQENKEKMPDDVSIVLSDISEGILRDAKQSLDEDERMSFLAFDCEEIPYEDGLFDRVIANHVLFYCNNVEQAVLECARVLKKDGMFIASTYGRKHMKEITELVQAFNPDIVLSANRLYEKFGLENGKDILSACFEDVEMVRYKDEIVIDKPEPLIAYILSCHGNQNHLLIDHYKEFREFVTERVQGGFHITKDAGVFVCRK